MNFDTGSLRFNEKRTIYLLLNRTFLFVANIGVSNCLVLIYAPLVIHHCSLFITIGLKEVPTERKVCLRPSLKLDICLVQQGVVE